MSVVPEGGVLVVDGIFLQRDELHGRWGPRGRADLVVDNTDLGAPSVRLGNHLEGQCVPWP